MVVPRLRPPSTDPTREYVAGGDVLSVYRTRVLPWAFDDLTQELGDDVYERMLTDAQVRANLTIYKASILEDGATLTSAVPDADGDGYEQAADLVALCEQQLDDMQTSLDDSLWSLLDALALGCKVAEEVYDLDRTLTGRRSYRLRALKVKPRRATAFVVDSYWNILGLLGQRPGQSFTVTTSLPTTDQLLPRDKFLVFTFRPKDHDPRGTTLLRAAYNAYALKMETWPEYLKYLIQFASASLIGTTAENASDVLDTDGAVLSAEQAMLQELLAFRNGSAIALPYGATVKELMSEGEGDAFLNAFSLFDRQITTAMLTATRATMESEYGSKADSATAASVLNTLIRQTRKALARALRRDVLMDLVRWHVGPEVVSLTPHVSFGETTTDTIDGLMNAIAALQNAAYLDASQLPGIDAMLGLPERSPDDMARRTMPQETADDLV